MSEIYSLDIETRSKVPELRHCAGLEPWRVRQGKAEISSIAICRPDDTTKQLVNKGHANWANELLDFLEELRGKVVYAHHAIFDVAWQIATLQPRKFKRVPQIVRDIRWRDTMYLTKWLINGQKVEMMDFSYSLVNLVQVFLPNHPLTPEFVKIKSQSVVAGENDAYWEERGLYDVILTRALAEELSPKLPKEQRIGLLTEFANIVPVANSWVNGIKIDVNDIERVEKILDEKMNSSCAAISIPMTVINSPKQLGNLLFSDWGLKPLNYGKTGGSTAKDDLLMIQYIVNQSGNKGLAEKMGHVMTVKENSTLKSKYIKTLKQALEHTGDGYIYGVPRIFATYTGRMSYSNETYKGGPKVSIALHQIPRKAKEVRGLFCAPEGVALLEDDASGQESRLMAIRSGDPVMLKVVNEDKNLHSMTGSSIIGMDYDDFMKAFKAEGKDGGYHTEQRQLGKLTNLSCNYRIGGRALSEKAFTKYDTFMTEQTGKFLVNRFQSLYGGIPLYWSDVIQLTKTMGYTEAYGGRRYKIHLWDNQNRWSSESSALMFPIQGAGAAMKEIAIKEIYEKFEEVFFCLDLHDASFFYCDRAHMDELDQEVLNTLNKVNYKAYWGFKPACPLTYESACGTSFKDVK